MCVCVEGHEDQAKRTGIRHAAEYSKTHELMVCSLWHFLPCPESVDSAAIFLMATSHVATQDAAIVLQFQRMPVGSPGRLQLGRDFVKSRTDSLE